MDIKLEPGVTFDGYWIDFIFRKGKELMEGEFKEFFSNIPDTVNNITDKNDKKKVVFRLMDNVMIFCKEHAIHIKEMNPQTLSEAIMSFNQTNGNALATATFNGIDDNGIFVLTSLEIIININVLHMELTREIEHMKYMEEWFTLTMRHELGHIIDFLSYHGKPIDEVIEIRDRYEAEKKAYYDSWRDKPFSKELSIKYRELEEEAVADTNGGVDVKRFSELEDIFSIRPDDTDVILTIDSKFVPTEGKNENRS